MSGPGSNTPRVAEIIGPPGSGKSTVARAIASSSDQVRLVESYTEARHAAAYVAAAVRLASEMLSRPREGSVSTRKHLNWMIRLEVSPRMLAEQGPVRVLFDQGPVYTLVRLLESAGGRTGWNPRFERWWERQVAHWAATLDLLVLVDAPDAALVDRIRGRAKDHATKTLIEDDAVRSVREARSLYDAVVGELSTARELPVLRVDTGSAGLDEVVARVRRSLDAGGRARSGGG